MRRDDQYGVVLTIEVRGVSDVYRTGRHLELGQVEFVAQGRSVLRRLSARLGTDRFLALDAQMEAQQSRPGRWRPKAASRGR